MAGGQLFPFEDLPESYFQGGSHLEREPDGYPDLHELFNKLRTWGMAVQKGSGTVTAGQTTKAVTFGTAFPVGTTVRVVATAVGQNVNVWASAVGIAGCTLEIGGTLGVDCVVSFIAFAE